MTTHSTFTQQLRHWSFHIPIWALPSFIFAIQSEYPSPPAILGMLVATSFFILSATVFGTFFPPANWPGKVQFSLLWGARFLSIYSLACLLMFFAPRLEFLMYPEIVSGVFAFQIAEVLLNLISLPQADSFLPAFLSTLIQGSFICTGALLLSGGLCISFILAMKPITTVRIDRKNDVLQHPLPFQMHRR